MPRKTYFMLDSGKFFEIGGDHPLPMNESEKKRYEEALDLVQMNPKVKGKEK